MYRVVGAKYATDFLADRFAVGVQVQSRMQWNFFADIEVVVFVTGADLGKVGAGVDKARMA